MVSKVEHLNKSTSLNNSQDTCLICAKLITIKLSLSSSSNESEEALRNIAKLLQVSPSIYDGIDFDSLPVPLLCSSCSVTIIEAVKLQDLIKVLQDRLKVLTSNVKQDLVHSFDWKHMRPSYNTAEDLGQVERIRKIYAQCCTPCEIRLVDCVEGYSTLKESSVQTHQLNLSLLSSIPESQGLGSNETEVEFKLDVKSNFWEHEDTEGWEDDDPLGVNDVSTREYSTDAMSEIVNQNVVECGRCGQVFHNKLDLNQHQSICPRGNCFEEFHLEDRKPSSSIKCHRCSKLFSRTIFLRRHLSRKVPCTELPQSSSFAEQSLCSLKKDSETTPELTRSNNTRGIHGTGKCHLCGQVFATVYGLRIHLNRKTSCTLPSEQTNMNSGFSTKGSFYKSFRCHRCGKKFSRKYTLQLHLTRKNPCIQRNLMSLSIEGSAAKKRVYEQVKCHRCGKVFARKSVLKLHLMKKIPCKDVSSTASNSSQDSNVETAAEHSPRPTENRCYRCGKCFERNVLLQCHLSMKIPCNQQNDDEKPELENSAGNLVDPDPQVKVVGSSNKIVAEHIPRTCHRCGEIFSSTCLLQNHLNREVPCTEREAMNPLTKDSETELIHKPKKLQRTGMCHRCGKVFPTVYGLQNHLNRKTPCNQLGDVEELIDTSSGGAKSHINIPNQCHRCGEIYEKNDDLQLHLMRKNPCIRPNLMTLSNEGSAFKRRVYEQVMCHHCGKVFSRKSVLKLHLMKKNPCTDVRPTASNVDPVKCHRCGNVFARKGVLKLHLMKKNPCTDINSTASDSDQGPTVSNSDHGPTVSNSDHGPTVSNSDHGPTVLNSDQGPTMSNSDQGPTVSNSDQGPTVEVETTTEHTLRPTENQSYRGKSFKSIRPVQSHRSMKVPSETRLGFSNDKSVLHQEANRRYTPAECFRCGKVFSRTTILRNHLRKKIPCNPTVITVGGERLELLTSTKSDISSNNVSTNQVPHSTIYPLNKHVDEIYFRQERNKELITEDYQLPEYEEPSLLPEIQYGMKQETNPCSSIEHHDGIPQIGSCTSYQPETLIGVYPTITFL